MLSDVFQMEKTHGASTLDNALQQIVEEGSGVLLYLEKPYSGIDVTKLAGTGSVKKSLHLVWILETMESEPRFW